MEEQNERLSAILERQLKLESRIADALETLNDEMAALLNNAGIYGPKNDDLVGLSSHVETLQRRYEESRKAREEITNLTSSPERAMEDPQAVNRDHQAVRENPVEPATLKTLLRTLPSRDSARLDAARQQVHNRLRDAQQKLTANQVVIFYSTEFHRRYLLGVLQCDTEEANYQADGQSFKLSPEKIIGRNC